MVKITMNVDGMACGMCESHVNEAIRKAFQVKKVTSSHAKGKTEIIAEAALDETALKNTVDATGYTVTDIHTEPYKKKGFSLFRK
ncbi:MAG: cation transporter [Eubacterium sp.]|nr:cation transporter [Eubacterium sp.]